MRIRDFRIYNMPFTTPNNPLRGKTSERFGATAVLQGFDLTGDEVHFSGATPPEKEKAPISKAPSKSKARRLRRQKAAKAESMQSKDKTLDAATEPNGVENAKSKMNQTKTGRVQKQAPLKPTEKPNKKKQTHIVPMQASNSPAQEKPPIRVTRSKGLTVQNNLNIQTSQPQQKHNPWENLDLPGIQGLLE